MQGLISRTNRRFAARSKSLFFIIIPSYMSFESKIQCSFLEFRFKSGVTISIEKWIWSPSSGRKLRCSLPAEGDFLLMKIKYSVCSGRWQHGFISNKKCANCCIGGFLPFLSVLCPKSAEHHHEHPQRSHADRRGGDAVSDRIITDHRPYEHKCTCAKCHVIECGMFRIWSAAFDNQNICKKTP